MTATTDMAALFAGHTGGYFAQHPTPRCVRQPVTLGLIHDHLRGRIEIGTYPVRPDATCRWGCIDIDGDGDGSDAVELEKAERIALGWEVAGIQAWIERSRTKGYHVWTFSTDWLPARIMRYAGLAINEATGVDSPEVNPKNPYPWTTSNGFVNTVRMPYPGGRKPGRMVVLDGDRELSVEEFARRAMASRTPPAAFAAVASHWQVRLDAESRRKALAAEWPDLHVGAGAGTGTQDAARILRGERRIEKGERDTQFYTVARYLHARNVPMHQALVEIERVWRDNCDHNGYDLHTATEKIERVYR